MTSEKQKQGIANLMKELITFLSVEDVIKVVLSHAEIIDCQVLTQTDLKEMASKELSVPKSVTDLNILKEKVYSSHDVDDYLFKEPSHQGDEQC